MECKKCGNCCRTMKRNFWEQAIKDASMVPMHPAKTLIIDKQIEMLQPRNQGEGCEMLDGDLCLIHKLLGYEFKPKQCRDYICEEENEQGKTKNKGGGKYSQTS